MSEAPKDGGAAFPSPGIAIDFATQDQQGAYAGMTLRDYFAAKAMAAITDRSYIDDIQPGRATAALECVANIAYAIADAMLKARGQ